MFFKIRNNLAPLSCVIDWNRFKQRSKRAKTLIQTATETIGNGHKVSVLEVYTPSNEAYIRIFACERDDMFSCVNTARKAAWLTLTQLELASVCQIR